MKKNFEDLVKEIKDNDYENDFDLNIDLEDEKNNEEDEFEKTLENELQNDCEYIKSYKIESENITDAEIENLDPKTIIKLKNKEIEKLKNYTKELEQEKEELFLNFKTTTNILLDRIKELEKDKVTGIRPVTAKILENLPLKNLPGRDGRVANNGMGNQANITVDSSNRCPACKLIFPPEKFFLHTLDCLRYFVIINSKEKTKPIVKNVIKSYHLRENLSTY